MVSPVYLEISARSQGCVFSLCTDSLAITITTQELLRWQSEEVCDCAVTSTRSESARETRCPPQPFVPSTHHVAAIWHARTRPARVCCCCRLRSDLLRGRSVSLQEHASGVCATNKFRPTTTRTRTLRGRAVAQRSQGHTRETDCCGIEHCVLWTRRRRHCVERCRSRCACSAMIELESRVALFGSQADAPVNSGNLHYHPLYDCLVLDWMRRQSSRTYSRRSSTPARSTLRSWNSRCRFRSTGKDSILYATGKESGTTSG